MSLPPLKSDKEKGQRVSVQPKMQSSTIDESDEDNQLHTFEEVLMMIHPIGKWQAWIYLLIAILQYFFSMVNIAVAFYQIQPEVACVIPGTTDAFRQMPIQEQLNLSSPYEWVKDKAVYDHCQYYHRRYEQLPTIFESAFNYTKENNVTKLIKCENWVFNKTKDMESTAVTQYNLVCDLKFGVDISQAVYMFGFLLGSLVSGILADKFGRKPTCVVFSILGAFMCTLLSFAPSYYFFVVGRFLVSLCVTAASLSTFVLVMETTSARWRIWVGGLFWLPYGFGYTSVAIIAALIRDWRILHVVISAPAFVSLGYWWLVPESPRWLLTRGRVTEAEAILRKAAKWNGANIPAVVNFQKLADNIQKEDAAASEQIKTVLLLLETENGKWGGKWKHPRMLVRAINLIFNWWVNALVYYGVLLNVSSFAGNKFVNNAIAGAVEIPGYMICVPLLWWGRRNSLSLTLCLAGISLFVVPWVPEDSLNWLRLSLAMFGKLCITASFAIVYVITGEIYPTEIRSSGVSVSSCIARIGSAIAPFISSIDKFNPHLRWLTMVIFGVLAVVAGVLTLFLPETKGKRLPEYLKDAATLTEEDQSKVYPVRNSHPEMKPTTPRTFKTSRF